MHSFKEKSFLLDLGIYTYHCFVLSVIFVQEAFIVRLLKLKGIGEGIVS